MSDTNSERLLGALLADVEGGQRDGLVDYAIRAGLRESYLGPTGGRIWRAVKHLKREGRPFDLVDVADAVNSDGEGDTVSAEYLIDLAGPGTSQGRFLLKEILTRAWAKEIQQKVDIAALVKRLSLLMEGDNLPTLEDGKTLLNHDFPPVQWLVNDLIVRGGAMLLAGRPKLGKSWLALQLAKSVTAGQDFLGHKTEKGIVLFLALEDGERRTQHRMKLQEWNEKDAALAFFSFVLPGGLDTTGLAVLREMIAQTDPALVVVDALAKVLPDNVKENAAEDMAKVLYPVSDLAKETRCCILIVHHHRKGAGKDGLFGGEDVRGSSAILAAVDGVISLYREGRANEARLCVQGRDIEDVEIAIGWTGSGWAYLGGPEILGQRETKRKVIEKLRELEEATAKDVADELHRPVQKVKKTLDGIVKDGNAITRREEPQGRGRPHVVYMWTGGNI